LDVEAWRDSLLSVAGGLDETIGGPSGNLASSDFRRRTLYGAGSRHNLDGLLRVFGFSDPNITSERRTVTTVPLQPLFVFNSDFMVRQAKALAARATASGSSADDARVRQAYRLTFGREATEAEVQAGVEFLTAAEAEVAGENPAGAAAPAKSSLTRWEQYAQ